MTHDRTYWRVASDKELIEAARDSSHELAIALGERLDERTREAMPLEDLQAEIQDLREQCRSLRAELHGG